MSRCCSGLRVEFSATAGTPSSSRVATWSSISAISGDTTTVRPSRSSAGTWNRPTGSRCRKASMRGWTNRSGAR